MFTKYIAILLTLIPSIARAESLSGEWEGQLVSGRRPIVAHVDFDRKIAHLDVTGSQELGLEIAATTGVVINFAIVLRKEKIQFTGTRVAGQIVGTATLDIPVNFALHRLPEYPPPADRIQAWRQDIDALIQRFWKYDRSYSDEQRKEAFKILTELQASLPDKSDPEIIVTISRAVARTTNAHTRLYLLRNRTELRRLPIRLWWFRDGLHVVKTKREYQDVLGCKVIAIGGNKSADVRMRVSELFAGNESWRDYKSVYYMTSPEILGGLGLVRDMEKPDFTFQCSGREQKRTISPLPLVEKDMPTEAWWDLTPQWKEGNDWVHGLGNKNDLPLYLKHPDQHYWFEYLAADKAMYFQYNRSQNQQSGDSLEQFGERLLAAVNQSEVKTMIVDLRFNTGGDLGIARDLMEKLKKVSTEKKIQPYVLISRSTFSAGISHAGQWKGDAKFVGEPVGDVLDFFSEGGNIVLPNSKLNAHYANGFHAYSKKQFPALQPHFLDMDVEDLNPDLIIRTSSAEYFAGRDPILDAVLTK